MTNAADTAEQLYPLIDPFEQASLEVASPHSLYFEQSGNPKGYPVVFLHGGPGSQTNPDHRRYFDPSFYRVVLFDQRGCGRSTPAGCVQANTTWDLVSDMERIRCHLGIEKWLLFGGSWGSTLALAYASRHPQRVAGMILRGVFLASEAELDWYLNGLRRFVPEAWQRLTGGSAVDVVGRYYRDVNHADEAFALDAARRWVQYEQHVMAIGAASTPSGGTGDDPAILARARVQLHYLAAGCFLTEGQLLQSASSMHVPVTIVQGRADMVCPPVTAYDLRQRLPGARLQMIEGGGHSAAGARLAPALRSAADDMRSGLAGAA